MKRQRAKKTPAGELGLETFRTPAADDGLSLESATPTSAATATKLEKQADPYDVAPPVETLVGEPPPEIPLGSADECEICPRTIVEAMLFVGAPHAGPLSPTFIASLMRGVRPQEIDDVVKDLNSRYDAEGCPYRIESVGDGYRMTLREEYGPLKDRFFGRNRGARLSQAAVDVLAVVAYQQPIGRDAIEKLRGKPSGAILNQLVRRQLLLIERDTGAEKTILYRTSNRFLELFGLESIAELPYGQDTDR